MERGSIHRSTSVSVGDAGDGRTTDLRGSPLEERAVQLETVRDPAIQIEQIAISERDVAVEHPLGNQPLGIVTFVPKRKSSELLDFKNPGVIAAAAQGFRKAFEPTLADSFERPG